jgi:15-cis-phytoene synthase
MNLDAAAAYRSSNFAPAFFSLPAKRRQALGAVYAFCRLMDDAVDTADNGPAAQERLAQWRDLLATGRGAPAQDADAAVWAGLDAALRDYPINRKHLLGLIDGVEMDLVQRRYATFEDLKRYCYGVASTVGLACLPIFGLEETAHAAFAIDLGTAVQLTNILRDVQADAASGRIYLPQEDLERFGYSEADLNASVYNENFVRLMAFQASRARGFYMSALQNLPADSRRQARPALIMAALYRSLLARLEQTRFRVFGGRVALPWRRKLRSVLSVLWEEWTL